MPFDGRVVVVVVVVVVVPLLQGCAWGAVYTVYSMGAPSGEKKKLLNFGRLVLSNPRNVRVYWWL